MLVPISLNSTITYRIQKSKGRLKVEFQTAFVCSITDGYLATAIQPRWSIDADLGGRFFRNKLKSGVRFHFHRGFIKTAG
ncbi:hypothetical protein NEIFLAOT_01075 [Neisseria flavescens NRL30031/H210]|uniref:Uncharacterized protein n=1 Tax=Neisseria flavescens NRL30031/H210 TaxID=546264 RepID=C0EMA4_NEIFL|nr:hypothetical protein NEIFLAOT_01075 [Neisseria flavescens NRL30031/H210]